MKKVKNCNSVKHRNTYFNLFVGNHADTRNKRQKIARIRWTKEQRQVITSHFKIHIKNKQAPRKHEVEELIKKHKTFFKDRNWVKIKAVVYNCYKKQK